MNNGNLADFPADIIRAAYGPAAGCPSPETWISAEWRALTADRQNELHRHATTCPACAAEQQLASIFDDADNADQTGNLEFVRSRMSSARVSKPPAEPDNVVPLRRRPVWTPVVGLAAAVLLGVALAPVLRVAFTDAPQIRGPDTGSTVRSARIDALAPMGDVDEAPEVLSWTSAAGATRYRVTLRRIDGATVWQTQTSDAFAAIPSSIQAMMQPAVAYTWDVTAFAENDSRLAWSETIRFRLAPAPTGIGELQGEKPQ